MTLIIGAANRTVAIQVGDRRLTTPHDLTIHDTRSNKSVIMLGTDGHFCVSYSGVGYIGRKPTDVFLAELLADAKAEPGQRPGGYATALGIPTSNSVGRGIGRLKTFIEFGFPKKLGRKSGKSLELLITGFLRSDPGDSSPRPFLARYSHHLRLMPSSTAQFSRKPRHFMGVQREQIGQRHDPAVARVHAYLDNPDAKTHLEVQEVMRAEIARASHRNKTIGPDCMSVVMTDEGVIDATFLPDPESDTGQTSFSPWVVGMNAMLPPYEFTGNPYPVINGFEIALNRIPALEPRSGLQQLSGQVRQPWPLA